ncbi:shikimate dehydrogenase [Microbacterium dextranolyticum]|uniref:Shikimate 5-dehydrogenase n=1 Tax=Microbacterium dextranolyticum TaxID=36806 RepID=A0A9W6HM75_9MICO|nr:shikimate dehydrogenase [Microbacterium dextranolyticum]MBM7463039.1 shikimate dehydrogenase [Microbacterium dextranolyticum]GLJ95855.1 shikimate 5-dehydrogenase [Microbacterium dextranolyticum]
MGAGEAVATPSAAARFEVWGDPIDHSLSPRLHSAAYAELGLPWEYGRRQVDEASFARALRTNGAEARGLSLTFPLKTEAHRAAESLDRSATLTGAVNTLVPGSVLRGFNTDVDGLAADLRQHGVRDISAARIVGAGATGTSALLALAACGATDVEVRARRLAAASPLVELGDRIGVAVRTAPLDAPPGQAVAAVPVTVSTLPGGAELTDGVARVLAESGGLLYDVVYGHWPTELAAAWLETERPAVNGLGMLLQQALRQIRIFSTGDPDAPLPREDAVVDVMRLALVGD